MRIDDNGAVRSKQEHMMIKSHVNVIDMKQNAIDIVLLIEI